MKPHYSNTNNPIDFPKTENKMNEQIEHCLYQAGLTAQGCWDELDDYAKEGIEKFAELIVRECAGLIDSMDHSSQYFPHVADTIKQHFGVEK